MKRPAATVGELLEVLRDVDPSTRVRTSAGLAAGVLPGVSVRSIYGDLLTVDVYPDCVIVNGMDPAPPGWTTPTPAPVFSPPPRRRR